MRFPFLSTLGRYGIHAAALLIAGLLPLGAQAATQCFNQNAPNPIEMCVNDDMGHQALVSQSGRRQQYYTYSGANLWLNGADRQSAFANQYFSSGNTWTGISNALTGSGSQADPYVITTVVALGSTGVQITQRITYVNGDRWVRVTWSVENQGTTTFEDVRFIRGGDTTFGGVDSARGWFDPENFMVYVTNESFTTAGFMGFYPNPATPAAHYFSGSYWVGRTQAIEGRLSDEFDSQFVDAGYYLEWNRPRLAPGETWVFEAFETWTAPGATQVVAPASDYVTEVGTTVRKNFKVHNLSASSTVTTALAVNTSGASWSASLPQGTEITLNPLEIRTVPVDIVVPPGAQTGDVVDVTLTATTGGLSVSGATRLNVIKLDFAIAGALDFGTVDVGTSTDRVVTFTNAPSATSVQIGSIASGNPLAAPWSIVNDQCSGQVINGGNSCTVTVRYAPVAPAVDATESFDWPLTAPVLVSRTLNTRATANQVYFNVNASAGANGSISPATASVGYGTTQQFTVTPNVGATITSVTGCGGTLSGNTYTTGAVTAACSINATFTLNRYAVTSSAAGNGSITPAAASIEHGSVATFTLAPAVGHHLAAVTGCGGTLSGNTYTTAPITGACAVNATFAINSYAVTAAAGANGAITPPSSNVTHGSTASFNVTPATGYHIESVSGCGGTLSGNTFTTGPVTAACAVNASFAINQYTVTATAGDNGAITPSTQSVNHGSTTTFTVTPATGYHIESVSGCAGTLNGNTFTTGAITAACAVNASFAINQYTVTATAGDNGTITPSTQNVDHGSTTSFTVTPATGYHIESVTGCSGTLSGNTFTTGAITGACAVNASFAINKYTVTATAGDNGTISPQTQSVDHGDTATFTVTPSVGYGVAAISGCGGTLSGSTYTTAPVTAACAINVSFEHTPPVFDASVSQPIDLPARALSSTLPASAYPQAFDYSGAPLEVTLVGGQGRYLPGEHTLTWRAVDERGIAATVQQVLRVWPTVSAGKDVVLGLRQGDSGSFKVVLNGPSPVYPFEVAYTVNNTASYHDLADGLVRFEQGEIEKDVYFAIIGTPPVGTPTQQVQVTLDPQANVGERHSLNVTLSVENLAPLVTLRASQGGQTPPSFGIDGGAVTIVADILDPNATDTHAVQWSAPQGATYTTNGAQLTLQPQSLAAGVHRFEAIVTDSGSPAATSRATLDVVIAAQTPVLPTGATGWLDNGLPDHPDYSLPMPNVLPERAGELHHFLVEADPGVTLALGPIAALTAANQAEVTLGQSVGIEPDTIANVGGYFDFVVGDLPQLGQSVNVVLPQRAAIPAQAVYRKYDPKARRWFTFVENANNAIASAPGEAGQCPPPNSAAYRSGLNVGDWCVRLTIEDGGPNDIDGERNGAVSDPGGVAATSSVVVTTKSSGGGGSFDGLLVLMGAALWLLRRQRRVLLALGLLPIAAAASADERSSWYVAADVAQARSGTSEAALTAALQQSGGAVTAKIDDEHRFAWRIRGGYEWSNGLGAELGYTDLGDVRTTITGTVVDLRALLETANAKHPHSAKGIEAALVGRYDIHERVTLNARAGLWHWESENFAREIGGQSNARNKSGTDILYGLGAQFGIVRNWSVDLDWTCYQVDRERIKMIGAGVNYRFF